MIPGLSKEEFQRLVFSVGKTSRDRRPLSPIEVGDLCAKAMAAGATVKGMTAALIMTDKGMVSKFLKVREISSEVRHLVSWGFSGEGAIGFSVAAQLTRLKPEVHPLISELVVKFQISRDEMTSIVQLHERSGQTLEECVQRVVRRRPIVRSQHIVMGTITSSEVSAVLGTKSQLDRDDILTDVIRRIFPALENITAKLGPNRFTLIGGKDLSAAVASCHDLERKVNEALLHS